MLDGRVDLGAADPEPFVEVFALADVDLPLGVPFWHLVLVARVFERLGYTLTGHPWSTSPRDRSESIRIEPPRY
jgi:hypothetical protein